MKFIFAKNIFLLITDNRELILIKSYPDKINSQAGEKKVKRQ